MLSTPHPKHILIDLDGTLTANREIQLNLDFAGKAFKALRAYGGWLRSFRAFRAVYGELGRPSLSALAGLTNDKRAVEAFAREMKLSFEEAQTILRKHLAELFPALKRHFYPVPGARDFLEWAHARYPLTLATNPVWPPEIVNLRLEWGGVDSSLFESMTHARIMQACKPTAQYYVETMKVANPKLEPQDFFHIGDKSKMDQPATRVGIPVFILSEQKRVKELKPLRGAQAKAWTGTYVQLRELLEGFE